MSRYNHQVIAFQLHWSLETPRLIDVYCESWPLPLKSWHLLLKVDLCVELTFIIVWTVSVYQDLPEQNCFIFNSSGNKYTWCVCRTVRVCVRVCAWILEKLARRKIKTPIRFPHAIKKELRKTHLNKKAWRWQVIYVNWHVNGFSSSGWYQQQTYRSLFCSQEQCCGFTTFYPYSAATCS